MLFPGSSWAVLTQYLSLKMKSFTASLPATGNGDAKKAEPTKIIKHKEDNQNETNKKIARKKWKQIARRAFRGSRQKMKLNESTDSGVSLGFDVLEKARSIENLDVEGLTLLQILAVNALELSAPASDVLLRNKNNNWIQLSGHEGSLAPAGPGTIWKKRNSDESEVQAYKELMQDSMADVVPKFYRDVEYNGENFMEIQDLLYGFTNPAIMDIKMGTRTFLEIEVQNTKARADLYEKMVKVDPNAPTAEERESGTITKLRYMQFRENLSSSSTLGFRIEGFKTEQKTQTKDLKLVKTKEDVRATMKLFLSDNEKVSGQLIDRLKVIRKKCEHSSFFHSHEVIGSSILLVHDAKKVSAWLIDFAKTKPLPEGVVINHRNPWAVGNHEDGYLFGLDNLISVLEDTFSRNTSSSLVE
ncbi:inositol-trisphosphate 3-kinase homolog isoform X2 [Limulus polyphemus]|uniref:Kinase n=1 Tax=Limulus polyphemus TaxID=6850 RepID=A0ABM1B5I1_LIMPO|nr:inositol-trisphosphate 3-kinase homolog isoform X2 [Limulus polyphemus]